MPAFISNCLRLFQLSLYFGHDLPVSDRRPGDDAALLAVMGLLRLYDSNKKNSYTNNLALIRSIVVLEHMLSHSKHNYDALLLLVRLYMHLGAGSLAMERYSRLSTKNIQYATISWVLFTRISTIHPKSTKMTSPSGTIQKNLDPLDDIAQMLHWYRTAETLGERSLHSMIENGLWNMSLNALDAKLSTSLSFTRLQLLIEEKRIQRFNGPSSDMPISPSGE